MTNLEGRVIRRRAALPAPGDARSELQILRELAIRLGAPSEFPETAAEVFDELRRASAGGIADYSGIDYERLDAGNEAFWPYVLSSTPRLFADRFPTADGRAIMVPVRPGPQADPPATGRQLTLITGRLLEHYQSGAQTRRVDELAAAEPNARLELHPVTATELGIRDGDEVQVTSPRGHARCRAALTTGIRPDTVFLPFHFPGSESANLLTAAAADPISGMPEFKTSRVSISRAEDC